MGRPKSFRELIVWQKSMNLARQAYSLSRGLPKNEAYGLLVQIRRAAVSIPSNIAEGHGRLTDSQFRHFMGNARGSLNELQTQVELAADLGYLERTSACALMDQASEVARILNGLITSLSRSARINAEMQDAHSPANSANSANNANSAQVTK